MKELGHISMLTLCRLGVKVVIIVAAFILHADYAAILIILGIVFVTELYRNAGYLIIRHVGNAHLVGAFISALDGALLIFALYIANALFTDMYLFVLFSISLDSIEFGLISAMTEGIVAGFAYAIFILTVIGNINAAMFFSSYMLRILFIVFLGWLSGWVAAQLKMKETDLNLVLENDIQEEQLSEMKNSFVTVAAEHLRTPAAAIRGYTDLLINGRLGELNDKVKEYLQNIANNLAKIESQTDELLHIIEIEDQSIKIHKKTTNLIDFVRALEDDSLAFSKLYKVAMTFEQHIPANTEVVIDAYRLKIALKNILFYICDAHADGVAMTISYDAPTLSVIIKARMNELPDMHIFDEAMNKDLLSQNSTLRMYTAKLIIRSHEGDFSIERRPEGIVEYSVRIPYHM